jgi:hypothetical protein
MSWTDKVNFLAGLKFFLLVNASRLALLLSQPPIQWVMWAVSTAKKWLVCEADHSPPSSAEVKNSYSYSKSLCLSFLKVA